MLLDKSYEPARVEARWYSVWVERGYFRPENGPAGGPVFSLVIPPPNVTGSLHIGHALNNSLQDILCRYKRMDGYRVLWVPGTDHAGIATQNVVEREVLAEGADRHQLGREEFVARVWQWKERLGGTIIRQLKGLGASCDWSRERFTLDEGLSRAVREVFVRLHAEGLIYRTQWLINWCPRCRTALSDLEVEHEEINGSLYHFAYQLADGSGTITVATTRPETVLGDTAVAVHPEDERYRSLVGREALLPVIGRRIPIIADAYVDRDFGSGAVKITPGHDFNDFQIGRAHNLPTVSVMDEAGLMNEHGGPYQGMDRFACRERLVADLGGEGVLTRTEPYRTAIGHCYRCRTVVEPFVSNQWFVAVSPLAGAAMAAVRAGRTRFVPAHWERTYFAWMENIRDWCISRQLWWGHRIPAWYCPSCGGFKAGDPIPLEATPLVAREAPQVCRGCGGRQLVQDPDVLDTWFSSALWPFSTLGWPEETADLDTFYPTTVLVTSFDIIFFWVARMLMMGLKFVDDVPFRTVYIHALVRDAEGRKMSKSVGNVIDPLEVMDRYGTDAFRFTLAAFAAMGRDIKLSAQRIEGYRNFANKIWNAARFVLMHVGSDAAAAVPVRVDGALPERLTLSLADRWILSRLEGLVVDVRGAFDRYEFNTAANRLYEFLWHEYCDWYVELSKLTLAGGDAHAATATRAVLATVLEGTLRLLHPIMPFITEELWQSLPDWARRGDDRVPAPHLAVAAFPKSHPERMDAAAETTMAHIIQAIRAMRNLRAEVGLPPSKRVELSVFAADAAVREALHRHRSYIELLARVSQVHMFSAPARPTDSVLVALEGMELYVPVLGHIDVAAERRRLDKELQKATRELADVQAKLGNSQFVARAPEEVVEKERERETRLRERCTTLERGVDRLRGVEPGP
jgi:valyl-tRNA synthetase